MLSAAVPGGGGDPEAPVRADDRHGAFLAIGVRERDRRAEAHLLRRARGVVDDDRAVEALGEKTDSPVDLTQAPLAVDVVAVLGTVAVPRRPRHGRHHLRPLGLPQVQQFLVHPAEAAGCHVVLEHTFYFVRTCIVECCLRPDWLVVIVLSFNHRHRGLHAQN